MKYRAHFLTLMKPTSRQIRLLSLTILWIPFAVCTALATDPNPSAPVTRVNRLVSLAASSKIELDSPLVFKNEADATATATVLGIAGGVTGVHSLNAHTGSLVLTTLSDYGIMDGQSHFTNLDALGGNTTTTVNDDNVTLRVAAIVGDGSGLTALPADVGLLGADNVWGHGQEFQQGFVSDEDCSFTTDTDAGTAVSIFKRNPQDGGGLLAFHDETNMVKMLFTYDMAFDMMSAELRNAKIPTGGLTFSGTGAADTRSHLGLGTLATQNGTFSGTSSGTNTGDQTITLTGDVTGSGPGSFAATIGASKVTSSMIVDGTIVNADVNASAAIAYSKLALTGAILNADLAGSIDLTSKVTGVLPSANGGMKHADGKVAGSDWTSGSSTYSPVMGLSFAVGASENWSADFNLYVVGATAGGIGLKFQLTGPAVTSVLITISGYTSGVTTPGNEFQTAFSATPSTTFLNGAGMTVPVKIHIETVGDGTHSGTVQLQANNAANAGAGNQVTIKINSSVNAHQTN